MTAASNPRTWLVLARASNVPTVWSNCIAACSLGGWNSWPTVLLLSAAGSLFYTGGMFLNDFCDVAFDRKYKRQRPIVAGELSRSHVGLAAAVFLIAGLVVASLINAHVLRFGLILVVVIVAYDFLHKRLSWAPILMATCRFLLYLTAAAAGVLGVTPRALSFAVALALYVIGLSYLARSESGMKRSPKLWLLLLFTPILVGLYFDFATYGLVAGVPLLLWTCHSLFLGKENPARGVAALLAGIVLVDLLAVSPVSLLPCLGFAALFGAALLFQRYVPAT
jgi:UbiA prenyltransferase family